MSTNGQPTDIINSSSNWEQLLVIHKLNSSRRKTKQSLVYGRSQVKCETIGHCLSEHSGIYLRLEFDLIADNDWLEDWMQNVGWLHKTGHLLIRESLLTNVTEALQQMMTEVGQEPLSSTSAESLVSL